MDYTKRHEDNLYEMSLKEQNSEIFEGQEGCDTTLLVLKMEGATSKGLKIGIYLRAKSKPWPIVH